MISLKKKWFFFLFVVTHGVLLAGNQINYNPRLTQYVVEKKLIEKEGFCLIDVGASQGVEQYWNAFGPYLKGYGFDPLVNECNRLNKKNQFPSFCYKASYIVSDDKSIDSFQDDICSSWYARSSANSMQKNQEINYTKEVFNKGAELVFTNNKTSLDAFCKESNIPNVDFIKIDTDGFDYGVLKGAENLLRGQTTLGVIIETNFNGSVNPHANCFRNVDLFLVNTGFRLFDLSVNRYTKKDLPGKFEYKIPAQTETGQACWGDVLYLRDFVEMQKEQKKIPTTQLLKMACLMEIFGLPDCAAELLNAFKSQLSETINVEHCLDLLAQDMNLFKSYQQHLQEFKNNPTSFYP